MADIFTINDKVQAALQKLLAQHRLVFWYDDKAELGVMFQHLRIDGVEKLTIENNEFGIKYRVLVEQPAQKFLVYQPSPKPPDADNWLLDLVLSHYEFHTEAASLYLQDLDLPLEFKKLIQEHESFFASGTRLGELKEILEPEDTKGDIRRKMLAVICSCEPEWPKVLYALFSEALRDKGEKYRLIEKFNLSDYLWKSISKDYGYSSPGNATIKDFAVQLIHDHFLRTTRAGKPKLNKEAYLFVNRWKESSRYDVLYKDWSEELERELAIKRSLEMMQVESLLATDTYGAIDKRIIIALQHHLLANTLPVYTIQEWIDKRRVRFFYKDYDHLYEALNAAAGLLDEIRKTDVTVSSPEEGFQKYCAQWYKIDGLYRKYIYYSESGTHHSALKELTERVEKAYSNSFLLRLGDNWQATVDRMESWEVGGIISQTGFYEKWVAPFIPRDNRVFVIISDALRYESAAELREIILKEDRYTAELSAVLGALPSYTQLGMAALLPHTSLTFDAGNDTVYADGVSTKGVDNRTKVLQRRHPGSIAITAEDFLKMRAHDGRDFVKPYSVVYIYSNHIDKTGDDKVSEGEVFKATEAEFQHLLRIVRHVANMNGTNMIITADHGYIYQNNELEESDFTDFSPSGNVYRKTRRFVLGKALSAGASVKKWTAMQLGFSDDTEALIPKSINRMRVQGAGSRFVHGGASLQEIVIPVLEINKARRSDIEKVEVNVIGGGTAITSNMYKVSFYQQSPVGDKVLPRALRAGFYTGADVLISDLVNLAFSSSDRDAVAREQKQGFIFTREATDHNGQDVYLRLEELIEGTVQWRPYKTITYRMLIAFSSDFDDF